MSQLGFLGMSQRRRVKNVIYAPCNMRPVADVVDPEFGPDEIPPSLDEPGTRYLVGMEREKWHVDEDGVVVNAEGARMHWKDSTAEMKRRGARLMYLSRSYLPDLERADENSPLLEVVR